MLSIKSFYQNDSIKNDFDSFLNNISLDRKSIKSYGKFDSFHTTANDSLKITDKTDSESDIDALKQDAEKVYSETDKVVKRLRAVKIARKIARGEYVSASEIKFIKTADINSYTKAIMANYKRKSIELHTKYKNDSKANEEINNEKNYALVATDSEQADYSINAIDKLRKNKKLKIYADKNYPIFNFKV